MSSKADMRVASIQVGMPQTIQWRGTEIYTGIFKSSIPGPVQVRFHQIEGDGQADLRVHGGEHKAVYAYSADHYPWWRIERSTPGLEYGAFGENLTVSGLDETAMFLGNRYRVGSSLLEVSQPREPCFKLGVRFNDPSIVKAFFQSRRPGIYFRVVEEGSLTEGDAFVLEFEHPSRVTVLDLLDWGIEDPIDPGHLTRVLSLQNLPPSWRKFFKEREDS